jgi:predicted nuclease with RNAse H fold
VRYCGIVAGGGYQHLCAIEEVRTAEPPIRLSATFFEPGPVEQVAEAVRGFGDAVVAIAQPMSPPRDGRQLRDCDAALRRRGVFPVPYDESGRRMFQALANRGLFAPAGGGGEAGTGEGAAREGTVPEGAYGDMPIFETNPDGVFSALHGQRVPAKRHPIGVQHRIVELLENHVEDDGGELWFRRIEEIDAAAAALAAHRFAVGHACWVGDPAEGVIVLPGSRLPETFSAEGVVPAVPRQPLPEIS